MLRLPSVVAAVNFLSFCEPESISGLVNETGLSA
jgi:hypothetical protein